MISTSLKWLAAALLILPATAQENWPEFRGPDGQGRAQGNPPLKWSQTNNVTWSTPIHGRGWSSPVIWQNQIWVTTASLDGKELSALCLDRQTGNILHDLKLFDVAEPQFAHKFNSYASPTPVIEDGRIYVTFGSPGTACLDTRTGKVLWQRRDFVCDHFRGAGSSPIVFGNLLIMNFDGADHQFVAALDKTTGKTAWQVNRSIDHKDLDDNGKPIADGDFRKAFSTPHIATFNGQPLLISIGAKATYAYDPGTGEERWRLEERSAHSASTRPVIGKDLIYYPSGFARGTLLAVRPGGTGDITATHVAWSSKRNVPNKPSPILVNDLLIMIDDGGIASCLDPLTGEEHWRERVGGNYSASPVAAGDRVYFCSEEGKTTVVRAARSFEVLAENHLDAGFMSSPAIAGDSLFLRTRTHLYRLDDRAAQ